MRGLLVADAGSSKTDWLFTVKNSHQEFQFTTKGINPVVLSEEEISLVFDEVRNSLASGIKDPFFPGEIIIKFYGAGCISQEINQNIKIAAEKVFGNHVNITVDSDLIGAALALFGNNSGIACILGTGSNSGFYNGKEILYKTPSLGFILGDEGSGSYIGKKLLNYYFKGPFPEELANDLKNFCDISLQKVVEKVYSKPSPNAYLAGFMPFVVDHQEHFFIKKIVKESFEDFFDRNLRNYSQKEYAKIGFCGSIAYIFSKLIKEIAKEKNFKCGSIIKNPIRKIMEFHLNNDLL